MWQYTLKKMTGVASCLELVPKGDTRDILIEKPSQIDRLKNKYVNFIDYSYQVMLLGAFFCLSVYPSASCVVCNNPKSNE